MSHSRNFKDRSILRSLPFLLRALAIVGLAVLLLSLFVPSIGGAVLTTFAFQSPGESPPDPDPPGPSHSPPGQSHSPPGPFQSPPPPNPGGKGNGLGPVRHIDLHYVPGSIVYAPDATGKITIWGTYPENHQKFADWPNAIDYAVSKLPCLDFVQSNDYNSGRWFYALYLITENGERHRLQNFNPGCPDTTFKSWRQVPYLSEELLFSENLVFEVRVELDDSMNTPDYYPWWVVLRGQDIIE